MSERPEIRRELFTPASLLFSVSPRRNWSLNKLFQSPRYFKPRTGKHHKQDLQDPQDTIYPQILVNAYSSDRHNRRGRGDWTGLRDWRVCGDQAVYAARRA